MTTHYIYAAVSGGVVKNVFIIPFSEFDPHSKAQDIAQAVYGFDAVGIPVDQYPVQIGDLYENELFYRVLEDGSKHEINYIPTEAEKVQELESETDTIKNEVFPVLPENPTLDEAKTYKQKLNSDALEKYLETHPMLYTDGNYYGVAKKDRDEMMQQAFMANVANEDTVQWHSKGKKCAEWNIVDFTILTLAIRSYTLPFYNAMQEIKEEIMSCETVEDVLAVEIFIDKFK